MYPKNRKPQWWQLYLGLPLLSSLFVFEIDLHLDQADNIILQLLILGLIFMFVRAWLDANRGALMELDERAPERREPHGVRVYQFPAAEPVDRASSRTVSRHRVDVPQGEIKGVLDITFEMDAEQPDSLFQLRAEEPHTEGAMHLERFHSPAHKE